MIVISDSTALINLARIGRLELLPAVFRKIIVPQAVWEEVVVNGDGLAGSSEIGLAKWIKVLKINDLRLFRTIHLELDKGESEAITLAIEINAELLVIDEASGRKVAAGFGLRTTGVLGILLLAKQRGLIESVKPVMDELIGIADFRISKPLYESTLRLANET